MSGDEFQSMATTRAAGAGILSKLTSPFVNIWRFLKDVYGELHRVVWPSHEETYTFTVVVIIAILIVAIWVGVLDIVIARIMSLLGIAG